MKYDQIQPSNVLKPYIKYFGVLESDCLFEKTKTFKIIADGCPGLIFQQHPDCFLDKDKNRLPQLFLHGLTTKHSEKTTTGGHFRNIGVYFQPNALKSIFGIDASELTNQYVELDLIVKTSVSEQLMEESNTEKQIAILSGLILQQLTINSSKENKKAAPAIEYISAGSNKTSLADVQSILNLSERSLERIFNTHIGISPKLFLRISRFQAALNCVRMNTCRHLTEVAYEHSYADQSHFIRECNEFAGMNPKRFLSKTCEQVVNFPEYKV